MPGATWWVGTTDRVLAHGAVGWAALEPQREPTAEARPYDLASLTKPLATAVLAVLLERAGTIDLDEPVGRLLEPLAGSTWAATPLRELATHQSGLPAWQPLYLEAADLDGCLAAIAAAVPAGPRGGTLYSDLGYILLGAALERASGEPLDVLLAQHVTGPLALERLGFATRDRRFPDAAATERGNAYERGLAGERGAGHAWRTAVLRGEVHDANAQLLGGVAGHAGLFGTAEEVAAIAREIVRPERLELDERGRLKLLQAASGADRTVGFQTAAQSSASRGVLPASSVGHTGFTGTSLWIDPPNRRLYVLLTNRVHPVVGPRNFQLVRRGFHRLAGALR